MVLQRSGPQDSLKRDLPGLALQSLGREGRIQVGLDNKMSAAMVKPSRLSVQLSVLMAQAAGSLYPSRFLLLGQAKG